MESDFDYCAYLSSYLGVVIVFVVVCRVCSSQIEVESVTYETVCDAISCPSE